MRFRTCLTVCFIALSATLAYADDPVNLSTALSTAEPLDHTFTLSVSANKVSPPKDSDPILPGASVDQVSVAYDRSERDFGKVRAVAPPTMTLLNTAPSEPDIFQGMPAWDDFTLLADSLTDQQWQAITSSNGLAVSDLKDRQREMFMAMLPHEKLKIAPWYGSSIPYTDNQIRDLTNRIDETRLRIGRTASATIMYRDNLGFPISKIPAVDNTDRWELTSREDYGGSQDTLYGVKVRADVPNEPKISQLDYDDPALRAPVLLANVNTVADLVKAVAAATHFELYADARLEPDPLTVLFPKSTDDQEKTPPPSAGDLLQALAFCVTGTWRQVGPAYILTDDIAGVGTRTQLWYEFERHADDLRKSPIANAAVDLLKRHNPSDISWFNAPEAWSPTQMKPAPGSTPTTLLPTIDTTFDQLTPGQQALILRADKQFSQDYDWQYKHEKLSPPSGKIRVQMQPSISVQLIVPTVVNPVDMDVQLGDYSLFQTAPQSAPDAANPAPPARAMSPAEILAYLKSHPDQLEQLRQTDPAYLDKLMHPPTGKAPTIQAALSNVPHRAIIVRAKNNAEAKAMVDGAKRLGFNEVWLMVFEKGASTAAGSPFSKNQALAGGIDVVDAAVAEGKLQHVNVYPCLNLLAWSTSPPEGASDYTVLGETSKQAWMRERVYIDDNTSNLAYEAGMMTLDRPINSGAVYVDPFSAQVGPPLMKLIHDLASRPGVKGMVWRESTPTGYGPVYPEFITSSLPLGYNAELRLGFVRQAHVDPVDIVSPNFYTGKANTTLPMLDDGGGVMNGVIPQWLTYRHEAFDTFLQSLYDVAEPASTNVNDRLTLIVSPGGNPGQVDGTVSTYESWDNRASVPSTHSSSEGAVAFHDPNPVVQQSHHLTYQAMTARSLQVAGNDPWTFNDSMKQLPSTGIVVDLTANDMPDDIDPIKALASDMGIQ